MYKTLSLFLFLLFAASCTRVEPPQPDKKVILTDKAPASTGIYSQAIQSGNTLYLSGQVGLKPETRELAGEDLETQTHQALTNIKHVLEAAGYSISDVVKAQVFLADMDDYATFNEIYVTYFSEDPPARAVVEISRLPLDARVEIMITAAK